MKMLVLSDSHGNVENMARAVEQVQPDRIAHLGDVMRDGEKLHALFPAIPLDQVPGNCDLAAFDAPEKLLLVEDKRVLLCHGHTLHVKEGLLTAMYAALEKQVDVLLFGHTHRVFSEIRNAWQCSIPAASAIPVIQPTAFWTSHRDRSASAPYR